MTVRACTPVFLALALFLSTSAAAVPSSVADCPPATTGNAPPVYPEGPKARGIGGKVVLRVAIDACGRVLGVVVQQTSRDRALDAAAIQAVRQWRLEGAGVAGDVLVPVNFTPDPAAAWGLRTRDED